MSPTLDLQRQRLASRAALFPRVLRDSLLQLHCAPENPQGAPFPFEVTARPVLEIVTVLGAVAMKCLGRGCLIFIHTKLCSDLWRFPFLPPALPEKSRVALARALIPAASL